MKKITKENLFKPALSRGESKARTTDEISRSIVQEEVAERQRKTDRLKAMRLAQKATEDTKAATGSKGRRAARG